MAEKMAALATELEALETAPVMPDLPPQWSITHVPGLEPPYAVTDEVGRIRFKAASVIEAMTAARAWLTEQAANDGRNGQLGIWSGGNT